MRNTRENLCHFSGLAAAVLLVACETAAQQWGRGPEVSRAPEDDWAFELDPTALARLNAEESEFSCKELARFIESNDPWGAFYAVRDAALFDDAECGKSIQEVEVVLETNPLTNVAVAFYRARQGDRDALGVMTAFFDLYAMETESGPSVDNVIVSLFGFLPDWDETGRRLLRHAKYSDGAASEINGNALIWKRHLFGGDPEYQSGCSRAADMEGVSATMKPYLCQPTLPDLP